MKTLSILIGSLLLSLQLSAQDTPQKQSSDSAEKYCAKLKDGILTITSDRAPVMSEIQLANGTRIKTDGTVIHKDGTQVNLQDGDCIDKDGNLVESVSGSRRPEEKQR